MSGRPPPELAREGFMRLKVKTRHGPQMRDCLLRLVPPPSPTPPGGEAAATTTTRGYVNLDTKDSALAPGQFAAFYVGDECVGAGVMCGWSAEAAAAVGVVPAGEGAAVGVGPELAAAGEGREKEPRGAVLQQQGAGPAAAVGC